LNPPHSLPIPAALRSFARFTSPIRTHSVNALIALLVVASAMLCSIATASASPGEPSTTPTTYQDEAEGHGAGEQGPDTGAEDFAAEEVELPASGQFIADYALQFVGYPYVYAGNGPGGFDCSGFTQYVVLNMLGIDIGHDVAGQTGSGYWVEWGAWQPGDLVFFANTYRAGVSHVGIYIGDGQFVHAENEGTGVTISSVWSDYYSAHYYGATRLV
jgi:cell wall-associated NlpC family hydrolase